MRTAIIGAGASGLSLALLLDGDVTLFEATDRAAGHCAATIRDGWTYDRGPHIMFSRNREVLDFMVRTLGDNVHRSRRNNVVSIAGTFARYPLENDLAALPEDLRNRCLLDYLFNEHAHLAEAPANLHEWFLGVFGTSLTDVYLKPYNEKVWNVPLAELSMTWAERIPRPPAEDVVKGALGIRTEGYTHQLYFHYPSVGGYQAITEAWAALLRPDVLRLETPVTGLRPAGSGVEVVTADGAERFDRVVCTAPMPHLLAMVGDVPDPVRQAVDALQVNPTVVVTLGFRGVDEHQFTAAYFADEEYLVNRVSFPCVFSPNNGPAGHYSAQAEITAPPGAEVLGWSDGDLVTHVLDGLIERGVVPAGHPCVFRDVQRFEHAYVVYTVGYERRQRTVLDWAESLGIHPHGRFGGFEYLNVDGCVLRSLDLATRLNGRPTTLAEITLEEAA
jgi:protoporphyrinogen oxidase